MGVQDLDAANEMWFLGSINEEWPNYFWFLVDWMFERQRSVIKVVREGDALKGALLLYDGRIGQLRGEVQACQELLDLVQYERMEFIVPLELRTLLASRYRPEIDFNTVLMVMRWGEASPRKVVEPEVLVPEDSKEISDILCRVDPGWWGEMTEVRVRSMFSKSYWMGVRDGTSLRAVGCALLEGPGYNISIIATDDGHRNRGYATSIVSALVEKIFTEVPFALIHVKEDNLVARKVYEGVGFRPYRTYYLMRGEKVQ
jgi:ribosomal protein S18 acetylase RimI-like enzyme